MDEKPFGEYGCYVDECDGEGCVFDGFNGMDVADCDVALQLSSVGKNRNECKYWQTIRPKAKKLEQQHNANTCPNCGYDFDV